MAVAAAAIGADTEVDFEFFPIIRRYKSGRIERFMNIDPLPAGTDPVTGVISKDVVVDPATGLWARLFLPPGAAGKLPVVVYYHGGAYVVGSAADPFTHCYLNGLVAEAGVLAVAIEYRLAPEHPLPAAYEDSWEGLRWVASHANGGGGEPWLVEHGDFSRVFVAGASAGGNIAHYVAARAGGGEGAGLGIGIRGVLIVHPYFSGADDIGEEGAARKAEKAKADEFWRFIYPGSPAGLDDPMSNPFSDAAAGAAARVAAERVLVCVAEKDSLRDRGVWYYEKLRDSGYSGEVELLETMGEGHVFYCIDPRGEKAREMQERILSFLRK
uniref:Alpha/beta hydrolase fold-3 domain-containing protein n=1 Tax=Leersia perrieri TaxID=77586 RepID=A0A0D9WN83_9ORYZ